MHVLITGGSGFIGSSLAHICQKNGCTVSITGSGVENCVNCDWLSYDFTSLTLKPKPDVLFHLAAVTNTRVSDKDLLYKINATDAFNLIKKAVDKDIPVVYASSASVYGQYNGKPFKETDALKPLNIYAESKAKLDDLVLDLLSKNPHARVRGLRFSNVYGGQREIHKMKAASMVWQLIVQMKKETPILFKYGEQQRDFVYIDDVCQGLLGKTRKTGIYNIGAGRMWSFNDIVKTINEINKTDKKVKYIDHPFSAEYQNGNQLDISKARKYLKYEPKFSLEDGIKKIINYDSR